MEIKRVSAHSGTAQSNVAPVEFVRHEVQGDVSQLPQLEQWNVGGGSALRAVCDAVIAVSGTESGGKWKSGGRYPSSPPCPKRGEAPDTPVSWQSSSSEKTEENPKVKIGEKPKRGNKNR